MTDVRQAVANTKNLAKQFRGVLAVVEVLEEIAGLEQAKANADAMAEKARDNAKVAKDETVVVHKRLVDAEDRLKKAQEKAEFIFRDAEAVALVIKAEAHSEAEKIRLDARNFAREKNAEVRGFQAMHEERMAKADAEYNVLAKKVGKVRDELADLRKRIG